MMFYDTLRGDGVYRLGATQAKKKGCPIYGPWEDDIAQEKLEGDCSISPIKEVGTRVIICEPRRGFLKALKDGYFEKAIQETWFRLVEKGKLQVFIDFKGEKKEVEVPEIYQFDEEELDRRELKSWIYGKGKDFTDNEIKVSRGETYKIKKFCAVRDDQTVPERARGIALVSNGMKIVSLDRNVMESDVQEKIRGYVEFDRKLDQELRKGSNQKPNHYDLQWRASLPRAIREFVEEQLRKFGEIKLGIPIKLAEEKKLRTENAEKQAMRNLMQCMKRWGVDFKLSGRIKPGLVPKPTDKPGTKDKEVRLSFKNFVFTDPNKQPRIDWGENIDFELAYLNRTEKELNCNISLRVHYGDREIEVLEDNRDIILKFNIKTAESISPYCLSIQKEQYQERGEYRIKATLKNSESGEEVHSLPPKKFWVEDDPPEDTKWPFELQGIEADQEVAWYTTGRVGFEAKLYYNMQHPEFLAAQRDSEESENNYLKRIVHEGFICFVLARNDKVPADYSPLDTSAIAGDNPEAAYQEIMRHLAEVRSNIYRDGN